MIASSQKFERAQAPTSSGTTGRSPPGTPPGCDSRVTYRYTGAEKHRHRGGTTRTLKQGYRTGVSCAGISVRERILPDEMPPGGFILPENIVLAG